MSEIFAKKNKSKNSLHTLRHEWEESEVNALKKKKKKNTK